MAKAPVGAVMLTALLGPSGTHFSAAPDTGDSVGYGAERLMRLPRPLRISGPFIARISTTSARLYSIKPNIAMAEESSNVVLPARRSFPPLYVSSGDVAQDKLAFFHILERLKVCYEVSIRSA